LADGDATFDSGFPPLTMTPIGAGGKPPKGKDMNGILYSVTLKQRWQDAGMGYPFDSAFSTVAGGYPKGAILPNSSLSGTWINTTESNNNNPEVSTATSTGWVPLSSYGQTVVTLSNVNYTMSTLQASRERIVLNGTLTANIYLYLPPWIKEWTVENNTSGNFYVTLITTQTGAAGYSSYPNEIVKVRCDGVNIFRNSTEPGRLISIKTYSTAGAYTYTPSRGTNSIEVEVIGGGGGGGGARATSSGYIAGGGGGGGGGYARGMLTTGFRSGVSVTVGAGGNGGVNTGASSSGGASTFGGLITASGGSGGSGSNEEQHAAGSTVQYAGGAGGIGSGGSYVNAAGGPGGSMLITVISNTIAGSGGSSFMSGGATPAQGNSSGVGGAYGAGGAGALSQSNPGSFFTGGRGGDGVVIIKEYS
ncbi:TPA: hypothetical protein ACQVJK_005461, partial [Serratia marcescens]